MPEVMEPKLSSPARFRTFLKFSEMVFFAIGWPSRTKTSFQTPRVFRSSANMAVSRGRYGYFLTPLLIVRLYLLRGNGVNHLALVLLGEWLTR